MVSAVERPGAGWGTCSSKPRVWATDAVCANAAMRGKRASMDMATSISCSGEISSGLASKAYSSSTARASTFMMLDETVDMGNSLT